METQVDPPLIIASLLILAILGGSFALWMGHIRRPRTAVIQNAGIASWPIGWVNFGIFVCAIISVSFFFQIAAFALFVEPPADPDTTRELTPWMAVFSVLVFQLPMLLVFYTLRRLYPGEFAGRLSDVSLSPPQAFLKTVPLFIMFLPVIWLAALIWNYALTLLEGIGVIGKAAPQELITLLQGGGDPLAIVLLAVFAIVLAPIVEELIFRGCLYRFLKSQSTLLPAQIMSGALFSLIHFNLFSFLPLVIVGVLLARVYEKSGSILTPICFHALFNGFNLLILFLGSLSSIEIQ
jgi:hypothetical protein